MGAGRVDVARTMTDFFGQEKKRNLPFKADFQQKLSSMKNVLKKSSPSGIPLNISLDDCRLLIHLIQ